MSYVGSWGSDVVFESLEEDPTDFSLFLSFSYTCSIFLSYIYCTCSMEEDPTDFFLFLSFSYIHAVYFSSGICMCPSLNICDAVSFRLDVLSCLI